MSIRAAALAGLLLIGCSASLHSQQESRGESAGSEGPAKQSGLDPEIVAMVGQVSATNIKASIEKLAGFTTRNTYSDDAPGSDAIGGARDWIEAQFAAVPGLTVQLDPFKFKMSLLKEVTRENVVAWKPGTGHADRLIVIGGHYDSLGLEGKDPTARAPGANDSASQTALVVEAARLMAGHEFDATVVFVAFAGEEQGLVGSKAFASGYAKYFGPTAKVEAMFNCDIVGGDNSVNDATTLQQFRLFSPGTPREWLVTEGKTDDTSPSRGLMREVGHAGSAYVPSMTMVPGLSEDRPDRRGDHVSFIEQSIPAVRFIEAVESPNPGTVQGHQHSPNDLPVYVTPEYTARVAQVVIASAASLARAPGPPSSIAVTGGKSGSVTVTWGEPASGSGVDHYVVAGRATSENLYRTRLSFPASARTCEVTAQQLGLEGVPAYFVSIAAVDGQGHESLFAYPEYRCADGTCSIQPGSLDVTEQF